MISNNDKMRTFQNFESFFLDEVMTHLDQNLRKFFSAAQNWSLIALQNLAFFPEIKTDN